MYVTMPKVLYRHCEYCNKLFKSFREEHPTQHDGYMEIDQTSQILRFYAFQEVF